MGKRWIRLYNEDCIEGAKRHIKDESVDLILTDPPYGIEGDSLDKHYNRDEKHVLSGYIEVSADEYPEFSSNWIKQAERVLRPGGSMYIISGYTNLIHILNALNNTSLQEINHIIWKYNFGVYTKNKYISSHYHILYYQKPGGRRTFNQFTRFGAEESDNGRSKNYADREDVWVINREYKKAQTKNKNQLPSELLQKIILYSSNQGDSVCDFFLGGFGSARTAVKLGRRAIGFEKSKIAFDQNIREMEKIKFGELLNALAEPDNNTPSNSGKHWSNEDVVQLLGKYDELIGKQRSKGEAIQILSKEFGRGRFGVLNVLKKRGR